MQCKTYRETRNILYICKVGSLSMVVTLSPCLQDYIKDEEWGWGRLSIMLCRHNEGKNEKNISWQDAPIHYLTAAVTSGIPLRLSYLPVPNSHI
jgi:hypothetical protein